MFCLSERATNEITETKNEFGWWINETEMLISTPYSKKLNSRNYSSIKITRQEDFNSKIKGDKSLKNNEEKSEGLEMKFLNNIDSQKENEDFLDNNIDQIENQKENFSQEFPFVPTEEKEKNFSENDFRKSSKGISYTPEKLIKSEQYKIISPPFQSALIHSSRSRQKKLSELIDRSKVGAYHLERLLCPSLAEIEDYYSFISQRLLIKNEKENHSEDKGLSSASSGFEELESLCVKEKGRNHKFSFEEEDTFGIQSTAWSLDTSSEPTQESFRLQELTNLLSSSLENQRSPTEERLKFENVKINSDNPGILLDGFHQVSDHDRLTRLAQTIEEDTNLPSVIQDPENLYELQSKVERLRTVNDNIHKDIGLLKEDFQTDEWKVDVLLENTSNFRKEMQDLKFLDDLLNLLQGELERISQKSWPFVSGHVNPYNEEINLII